jgi:chorismate dehydratase
MLAGILFDKWWKIKPALNDDIENIENHISGTTAGVVIGDRALKLRDEFNYVYDLAEEWKKYTRLPFVFACWVSNKKLPDDFVKCFNEALKKGIGNKLLVAQKEKINYPQVDILDYFTNKISYEFDERKKTALELFLSFVRERLEKDVMKIV